MKTSLCTLWSLKEIRHSVADKSKEDIIRTLDCIYKLCTDWVLDFRSHFYKKGRREKKDLLHLLSAPRPGHSSAGNTGEISGSEDQLAAVLCPIYFKDKATPV